MATRDGNNVGKIHTNQSQQFRTRIYLFPPLFQELSSHPLLAAVLGALFVGIGVGLCVVAGGAPSGDDALAMALSAKTKKDIRIFYLLSDILVLSLSLTYIPPRRIFYSLITVILSGQIIGLMQRLFAILSKKTQ